MSEGKEETSREERARECEGKRESVKGLFILPVMC